jgi:ATP-binding protein involved in chromosome partitioning
VQLSLIQTAPITGAVVVTTPSDVSLEDARKAVHMFHQVRVPVLGMIENMSYLTCPHCGPSHQIDVFGSGGGERVAATLSERFGYDVPVLARVPLEPSLREGGDAGKPVVDADPTNPAAVALREVATRLVARGRGLAGLQLGLTPTSKF